MLGRLRESFEPAKNLLASPLARVGVHPLVITMMGLLFCMVASGLIGHRYACWAPYLALAGATTDLLDGPVARLQGKASAFGNYAEAIVDRLVEISLLLGLAPLYSQWVPYALAASLFVSYCKPRVALVVETDNRDWPGVGDHVDRMVCLLLAYFAHSWGWSTVTTGCLGLLTLLATVGAGQRLFYAHSLIEEGKRSNSLRC